MLRFLKGVSSNVYNGQYLKTDVSKAGKYKLFLNLMFYRIF